MASQRLLPPTLLCSTSLQFCRFPVLSLTLVPLTFNSFITALQPILKCYQVFPSICCIYTLKDWNITLAQCTLVQLAVCHLGFGFVVKFALGTEKQQRGALCHLICCGYDSNKCRPFCTVLSIPAPQNLFRFFLWSSISFVVMTAGTWVKLHRAWNLHLAEVKGRLNAVGHSKTLNILQNFEVYNFHL